MDAQARKGTLLGLAAESIAAGSERKQTVVDVVHGRALQHYGEALRQFLAIRLGDAALAKQALQQVRALATARGAEAMAQHPGIRARLFGLAREVADGVEAGRSAPASRAALPWKRLPPSLPAGRVKGIEDLRTGLDRAQAEVLELRHARELSVEELAFALGIVPEVARGRLTAAEHDARFILGDAASSRDAVGQDVLYAFSLERELESVERADTDEHEAGPTLREGAILGDRYSIQKCIGTGSFAEVYRASDTSVPGHMVAIKLLHQPARSDEARAAALRELHLIASVFHPSIVQFKAHGWHESRLWFVMPWYEGESLETRIRREALSRAEARRIFEPLARALATMHASGLRHQDVKPDNIFLARLKHHDEAGNEDVLPVLLDLGVAAKDAEMVVAGTPTYFAPEVAAQFAAKPTGHPITNKADVFSLALALKHALEPESEEDVTGGALEAFIEARAHEAPTPPTRKDLAFLRPQFERWLSVDPDRRPSAGELASALAILTSPEERRARRIATLKWLVPLALGTVLAGGGIIFALKKQAEFQAMQARAARLEAAEVRADLAVATDRGKTLETNIEQIRGRYESSKLTNRELTDKLAETEGALNATQGDLSRTRKEARDLNQALTASQATNAGLTTDLERTREDLGRTQGELQGTRRDLEAERVALAAEQAKATALARDLTDARTASQAALERANDLNRELSAAKTELATAREDKRTLERTVRRLEGEKTSLDGELANLRRKVERLERDLAEAERKARETRRPLRPAEPINP